MIFMRILKAYTSEENKYGRYGTNTPLIKEIRNRYGLDEVVLEKNYDPAEYAQLLRNYDVILTSWSAPAIPDELATNPGNLKYLCHITGEMRGQISEELVSSPYLTVTNWGDAPAYGVAEGAFALLMTMVKDLPLHIKNAAANNLNTMEEDRQTTLYKRRIGIYGMGVIAKKFIEFLRPFCPIIYGYDPYAKDIPEGVIMVDSLEELFGNSQIMVIHAGLTEETRGSVNKKLLAMLPDGGIVINTARGGIIDWEAMREEILSNRLRVCLDVVGRGVKGTHSVSDMPEVDDPVRFCDNAVFTAHHVSKNQWGIDPEELVFADLNCLDNLERFSKGEPLKFVMTPARYKLST